MHHYEKHPKKAPRRHKHDLRVRGSCHKDTWLPCPRVQVLLRMNSGCWLTNPFEVFPFPTWCLSRSEELTSLASAEKLQLFPGTPEPEIAYVSTTMMPNLCLRLNELNVSSLSKRTKGKIHVNKPRFSQPKMEQLALADLIQKNASIKSKRPRRRSDSILSFPPEIRLKIFEYAMQDSFLKPRERLAQPALLSALSGHPNPEMYAEAQEAYNVFFRTINHANEEAFKKVPFANRLRIKHLEIVAPIRFRAQTLTLRNNIQILTLDYSGIDLNEEVKLSNLCTKFPVELAKALIGASKQQVKRRAKPQLERIVLKASKDIAQVMKDRIDNFGSEIVETGIKSLRMILVEKGMLEEDISYWIWEAL